MRKLPSKDEPLATLLKQAEHYANFMMRGPAGTVPATLMALTPEGFVMHVPQKFGNEAEKDRFAKIGRLLALGYRADAIAIISESWIVVPKRRGMPLDMSVPPSQSPDREEVVAIMAEGNHRASQRLLFIQRDSFGSFSGFGASLLPEVDHVEGRFAGLMPPKAPTDEMTATARNLLKTMGISVERHGADHQWN
jgi:hypothetical protein